MRHDAHHHLQVFTLIRLITTENSISATLSWFQLESSTIHASLSYPIMAETTIRGKKISEPYKLMPSGNFPISGKFPTHRTDSTNTKPRRTTTQAHDNQTPTRGGQGNWLNRDVPLDWWTPAASLSSLTLTEGSAACAAPSRRVGRPNERRIAHRRSRSIPSTWMVDVPPAVAPATKQKGLRRVGVMANLKEIPPPIPGSAPASTIRFPHNKRNNFYQSNNTINGDPLLAFKHGKVLPKTNTPDLLEDEFEWDFDNLAVSVRLVKPGQTSTSTSSSPSQLDLPLEGRHALRRTDKRIVSLPPEKKCVGLSNDKRWCSRDAIDEDAISLLVERHLCIRIV